MTVGGWIFMCVSVGFVWGLCLWCFSKVLTLPPEGEERGPGGED
jgi:hypothetical protein